MKSHLEEQLSSVAGSTGVPGLASVRAVVKAFARRPVSAAPFEVRDDMYLCQWLGGGLFTFDFTRQYSLYDEGGDYDRMEQTSLSLLYPGNDPDLAEVGSDAIWSGSHLDEWIEKVEALAVFKALLDKDTSAVQLNDEGV